MNIINVSLAGFIDFIVDPSFQVMGDMLEKIILPLHQRNTIAEECFSPSDKMDKATSTTSLSSRSSTPGTPRSPLSPGLFVRLGYAGSHMNVSCKSRIRITHFLQQYFTQVTVMVTEIGMETPNFQE